MEGSTNYFYFNELSLSLVCILYENKSDSLWGMNIQVSILYPLYNPPHPTFPTEDKTMLWFLERLEWRDWWMYSVSWIWGIFRFRGETSRRQEWVGTVRGAGTSTVWEVGYKLYILVASSSENLLLFIKWCGLRGGNSSTG